MTAGSHLKRKQISRARHVVSHSVATAAALAFHRKVTAILVQHVDSVGAAAEGDSCLGRFCQVPHTLCCCHSVCTSPAAARCTHAQATPTASCVLPNLVCRKTAVCPADYAEQRSSHQTRVPLWLRCYLASLCEWQAAQQLLPGGLCLPLAAD
eukprot:GHRQ01013097.1.p3 GENE.GHRQ01013097.1~~GHRQ01013097.1.p3  ORF type:complete len:153 (-),score=21.56 GHRQ01013097.1:88-546(-)